MQQLRLLSEEEIEKIYHSYLVHDFPPSETKPLKAIMRMMQEDSYFCYGMYEDGRLLSYAFFVSVQAPDANKLSVRKYLLLDYFAVAAANRGTGIGSKMLSLLKESLLAQSVILIEAENPDDAADKEELRIRKARSRFYLNNACLPSSITSIVYGVGYCIFCLYGGGILEDADIKKILETIYRRMFSSHDVWEIS